MKANNPEIFLIQIKTPDDPETYVKLATGYEIVRRIDMYDCYEEELEVYRINEFGKVDKLEWLGTWHDRDNPLLIELVDSNGNVVFAGYGTDH